MGVERTTDDLVRIVLAQKRKQAHRTLRRGLGLFVLMPMLIFVGLALTSTSSGGAALIALGLLGLATGAGGILLLASGAADLRRAKAQLRAFDERRQLPAARVVIR